MGRPGRRGKQTVPLPPGRTGPAHGNWRADAAADGSQPAPPAAAAAAGEACFQPRR